MSIHPDDVRWACIVAERDAMSGRPFVPYPDTPSARAVADDLLELPIEEFLLRLQQIREKHGRGCAE